jgi:hypothetical protein
VRRGAALLLVLVTALALAAPAVAWTGPGKERRAIQRAALDLLQKPQRSQAVVRGIRVSTASKRWAMATIAAKPRFVDTFQSFLVVLLKVPLIDGSFTWIVADFGNAFVGCGAAPLSVLRDLYEDRTPCAD